MLTPVMIRMLEAAAGQLKTEVMKDVTTHPRTKFLHHMSLDELEGRVLDLYSNLDRWLTERRESDIQLVYQDLGGRRYKEGVPLHEFVFAMLLVKEHLWSFIRRNDILTSEVETYQQEELGQMIGTFFDRAVYHAVKGYELARMMDE